MTAIIITTLKCVFNVSIMFWNLTPWSSNHTNWTLGSTGPTLRGWEREAWARSFGWQMRLLLGRAGSLRAAAAHVSRDVMGASANLRSKTAAPGSPRTDVRLAAVHGEWQAGEVCESRGLTVADHPEQRWGVLHRWLGSPVQCADAAHITCAHEKKKINLHQREHKLFVFTRAERNNTSGKTVKLRGSGNTYLLQSANEEQEESNCAHQHVYRSGGGSICEPDR